MDIQLNVRTVRDMEANGGATSLFSCLCVMEEPDVEEGVELQSIKTADNSDEGNTDLHEAVLAACKSDDVYVSHDYNNIDRLMSGATNLNVPNKKGYTAVGIAVEYSHKKTVKHMLKHPSADRLYLDYYPGDRESTVREIILQNYPDFQPLLPAPLMESLDSSDRDRKLLAALQHDQYDIFNKNLHLKKRNTFYCEPYNSSLLEIACQMKNRKKFVQLLLDNGANPNIRNSVTGMPLLHATARSGNLDVLKVLLKQRKINTSVTDNKNRTILHWLARLRGKKAGDKERLDKCFNLVLNSCEREIIDRKDDEGNTALYVAVKNEFRDRVLLLLKRGADVLLSIHGTPILSSLSTPMMKAILDDCLECNDKPETSKDLKLTFSYGMLHKIMPRMAECPHQRELLKHPVTSCFINLYYSYITAYILFFIVMYSIPLFTLTGIILSFFHIPHNLYIFLSVMWTATALSEFIFNWCLLEFIDYLRTLEHALCLPMLLYLIESCLNDFNQSPIWPHMLVISFLLAWMKLVVMTGRLPLVAVQMEMFKRVSLTLFKYMASYSIILITLALTIFVIFKESSDKDNYSAFPELFYSLVNTTVMFTGAFEFFSIKLDTLPYTSHSIFVLFVFMVPIILMNLVNGLAVFDTHELVKDAETIFYVIRVRILIKSYTYGISQKLFEPKEIKEGKVSVYPNRWKPPFRGLVVRFTDPPCFSDCIRTKRQPSKELKLTEEKWKVIEQKFDMRLNEMQDTLNKIVTRLDTRQ